MAKTTVNFVTGEFSGKDWPVRLCINPEYTNIFDLDGKGNLIPKPKSSMWRKIYDNIKHFFGG